MAEQHGDRGQVEKISPNLKPQLLLNMECFILEKGCVFTETLRSLEQWKLLMSTMMIWQSAGKKIKNKLKHKLLLIT